MQIKKTKSITVGGVLAVHELCYEVQKAVLDGWRVEEDFKNAKKDELCLRKGMYGFTAVLSKYVDQDSVEALPDNIPKISDFNYFDDTPMSKEGLFEYAASFSIEIPDSLQSAKALACRGHIRREMCRLYELSTGEKAPAPMAPHKKYAKVKEEDVQTEDNDDKTE